MRQRKLSSNFFYSLGFFVLALAFSACGVKGKPLPPEQPIIMKKDRWADLEKKKKEENSDEEDPAKKDK